MIFRCGSLLGARIGVEVCEAPRDVATRKTSLDPVPERVLPAQPLFETSRRKLLGALIVRAAKAVQALLEGVRNFR